MGKFLFVNVCTLKWESLNAIAPRKGPYGQNQHSNVNKTRFPNFQKLKLVSKNARAGNERQIFLETESVATMTRISMLFSMNYRSNTEDPSLETVTCISYPVGKLDMCILTTEYP